MLTPVNSGPPCGGQRFDRNVGALRELTDTHGVSSPHITDPQRHFRRLLLVEVAQTIDVTSPETDGYAYSTVRRSLARTPSRIARAKRLMKSSA